MLNKGHLKIKYYLLLYSFDRIIFRDCNLLAQLDNYYISPKMDKYGNTTSDNIIEPIGKV